jgi:hypothetical protein
VADLNLGGFMFFSIALIADAGFVWAIAPGDKLANSVNAVSRRSHILQFIFGCIGNVKVKA